MRALALAAVFVLGACTPSLTDYQSGMVTAQERDFAECRIRATQVSGEYGGLAALAAFNRTMNDCMTARGYTK